MGEQHLGDGKRNPLNQPYFFLLLHSGDFAFVTRLSQSDFFLQDIKIEISIRTFPNDATESNLWEGPLNGIEGVPFLSKQDPLAFGDR